MTRRESKAGHCFGILLFLWISLILQLCHGNPVWDYDTLQASDNVSEAIKLDILLSEYNFTDQYLAGHFDCSDSSMYTYMVLKDHGYKVIAMANDHHMWLAVGEPDGWLFVETTYNYQTCIGKVVIGPKYETGIIIDDPHMYLSVNDKDATRPSYSLKDKDLEEK